MGFHDVTADCHGAASALITHIYRRVDWTSPAATARSKLLPVGTGEEAGGNELQVQRTWGPGIWADGQPMGSLGPFRRRLGGSYQPPRYSCRTTESTVGTSTHVGEAEVAVARATAAKMKGTRMFPPKKKEHLATQRGNFTWADLVGQWQWGTPGCRAAHPPSARSNS